MWKLPEKNDGKHDQRAPLQPAASGGEAEHARHSSRKRSDKSADGMNLLQRCVGCEIDEGGRQGQQSGQAVRRQGKIDGSAHRHQDAHDGPVQQTHSPRGQWTHGGAAHASVHFSLPDLIQRGRASSHHSDSEQSVKQAPGKGGGAVVKCAKIETAPCRRDDERRDSHFGEFRVVAQQRLKRRWGYGIHAATGLRSRPGTLASKATGTWRQTCMARMKAVARRRAPTATCTTVETIMGSSGCAASCPQVTRVMKARKPRHNCATIRPSMVTAGRRTASIFQYT